MENHFNLRNYQLGADGDSLKGLRAIEGYMDKLVTNGI